MRKFFIIILAISPLLGYGQENLSAGLLPALNLNKKLPKDWSVNFKTESRQAVYSANEFDYQYLLTDYSLAAAKKVGINTTIAVGYLLRVAEENNISRAIQQLSTVRRYSTFKLAHRFVTDQTFRETATEYRLRYRASGEVPLDGYSLDPKEFFIKINQEFLNALEQDEYEAEIRFGAYLGYFANPDTKIEMGVDHRIDSFIGERSRHRMWLSINLYQSL